MAEFRIVKRTEDSEVWEKSQDARVSYIKIVFDHDLDAVVAYTSDHKGPWVGDNTRYDSFQEAQEAWGISDEAVLAAPVSDPIDDLNLSPEVADCLRRIKAGVEAEYSAQLQEARARLAPIEALDLDAPRCRQCWTIPRVVVLSDDDDPAEPGVLNIWHNGGWRLDCPVCGFADGGPEVTWPATLRARMPEPVLAAILAAQGVTRG